MTNPVSTSILNHPLFDERSRYLRPELNALYAEYAQNDELLHQMMGTLLAGIFSPDPHPPGSLLKNPEQLKAWIDMLYALEYLADDAPPPFPRDDRCLTEQEYADFTIRFYGEIKAMFATEPFASLIEGAALDPSSRLVTARFYTLIKGLLFWVEDGPSYEDDPAYVMDGSDFLTTLSRVNENTQETEYLVVDATGAPVLDNDEQQVYKPLPAFPNSITLIDFRLNGLMVEKLRKLYRIGCFEAGIDAHFIHENGDRPFPWSTFGWVKDVSSPGLPYGPQPDVPLVNAGLDSGTINTLTYGLAAGVGEDGMSPPATYLWTMISGPGIAVFTDDTALHTDVTVNVDGTYVFRLTATNAVGPAFDDISVTFQDLTAASPDVGEVPIPFFTTTYINQTGPMVPEIVHDTGAGTVRAVGCGNDMDQGSSDQFAYYWSLMTGNGSATIRVISTTGSDQDARTGVQIRESLAHNARFASIARRRGGGGDVYAARRNVTGAASSQTNSPGSSSLPFWFRIERDGDNFRSYWSTDGITFTNVRDDVITGMPDTLYIGIACDADQNNSVGRQITNIIDNITFTNSGQASHSPPKVSAGLSQNHVWNQQLFLTAVVANDGLNITPLMYQWIQQAGPTVTNITDPTSLQTQVTSYNALGAYAYEFTVDDNENPPVSSQTTVDILDAQDNQIRLYPERYPAGFTDRGEFQFLRDSVAKYGYDVDLTYFIPESGNAQAGTERRVIMDESMVMTPIGLIRLPRCILDWSNLVTDADLESDFDGDPVTFLGLQIGIGVVRRDIQQIQGTAEPAFITGPGTVSPGITLLEKAEVEAITNIPPAATLGGPQSNSLRVVGKWGHQHGQLIGYIQTNRDGPDQQAQYVQMTIQLVAHTSKAGVLHEFLRQTQFGTEDEILHINETAGAFLALDTPPYETIAFNPRIMMDYLTVQGAFPTFAHDAEQGCMVRINPPLSNPFTNAHGLDYIFPMALHLEKNDRPFTFDNLNGAEARFSDAWAIRKVSSVQQSLSSIFFDVGDGLPENFPPDFVGAGLTVYPKDGSVPVRSSITKQIGDKLAQVPAEVIPFVETGTVVAIDQRVPNDSLDLLYRGEVAPGSLIDLRLKTNRYVDPVVTKVEEVPGSPASPASPASPEEGACELAQRSPAELSFDGTYTLERVKDEDRIQDSLRRSYNELEVSVEPKARFHLVQQFIQKAANRWDVADLRTSADALNSFLLAWINEFNANQDKSYVVNENLLIHWPDKQEELTGKRETVIPLDRYPTKKVLTQEDTIVIKDSGTDWGDVPFLQFFFNVEDHIRYPLRFTESLAFVSERSFVIPGHQRFAGSFFLEIEDTHIPQESVSILLERQREDGTKEYLGSFDLDHARASSFSNVQGVFRLDGEASYNPQTRRISINYSDTQNFSSDQPGIVTITYVYNDLTQTHPLFVYRPDLFGLQVSHLHDAIAFTADDGVATAVVVPNVDDQGNVLSPEETVLTLRLEGISDNGGDYTIRWNKDDVLQLLEVSGFIETLWVLRGIPWITIGEVEYDDFGVAIGVEYEANWISQQPLVTSQINNDDRNQQWYQPCAEKYGWIDITRSQIHTEANPLFANPSYIFYQRESFLTEDGALDGNKTTLAIQQVVRRETQDYRFMKRLDVPIGDITPFTNIASVAIFIDPNTGERKVFSGIYHEAEDRGSTVALLNELDLLDFDQQDVVFMRTRDITGDYIPEFIGVVVTVRDTPFTTDNAQTKLQLLGHYYADYPTEDRVGMVQTFGVDAVSVQTSVVTKLAGNWRCGDFPFNYLYRNNNILQFERKPGEEEAPLPPGSPGTDTDYPTMILADTPLIYLQFKETFGPVAADSSINNLAASYVNDPVYGVPSLIQDSVDTGNEAIRTNGSNQYVNIANGPINVLFTQRSWEFSFKAEVLVGRQTLFEEGGSTNGAHFYLDGTTLRFGVWENGNLPGKWLAVGGMAVNARYHVVGIYNGDTGEVSLMVNGIPVDGSVSGVPAEIPTHTGNSRVAAAGAGAILVDGTDTGGSTSQSFRGTVDDFSIFPYALTPSRAVDHYAEAYLSGGSLPLWTPTDLGSILEAFYEAEAATTAIPGMWVDKSGLNNHAIQPAAGARATYDPGTKTMVFLGDAANNTNGQFFQIPATMSIKTMVLILEDITQAGGIHGFIGRPQISGNYIYLFGNQQVGATYAVSFDGTTSNQGRVAFNGGPYSAPAGNAGSAPYPTGQSIAIMDYDVPHTNWETLFAFSNNSVLEGYRANLRVKAVLLLNTEPTGDQKERIEGWAAHNLLDPSILPPGHPYETDPPII